MLRAVTSAEYAPTTAAFVFHKKNKDAPQLFAAVHPYKIIT